MRDGSTTRYLRVLTSTVLALIAMAALVNVLIDPFSVFGTPHLRGLNANKLEFLEHLRLTNAYAVIRRHPDCILLGTSRTGRGVSATHASSDAQRCYNLALPAISLYEMRRYVQHAQAVAPLSRVFLGIDFRVFNASRDDSGAFAERRLRVDSDGRPQSTLFTAVLPDLAASAFSLPALRSSARTVRQQRWAADTLADNGDWIHVGGAYDHYSAFRAFTRNSLQRFAQMQRDERTFTENADEYRTLLRMLYAAGVDARIYVPPSHARHWQTLEAAGLWPRFEAMKRIMVQVNAEEAAHARRTPFPIWDFTGPIGPSLEPAPAPGGELHWYWETVHFKPAVGAMMLDRMAGMQTSPFPEFGTALQAETLEQHLRRLRNLQRAYAESHPDGVREIRMIAAGLRAGEPVLAVQ